MEVESDLNSKCNRIVTYRRAQCKALKVQVGNLLVIVEIGLLC